MDECGESSYKKLLMNRFVRTGNYGDPIPVYSPGIDYTRRANDAEMEVMFSAIMHSALNNNKTVIWECQDSISILSKNKHLYTNYNQVYEHQLTIYTVAMLAPLALYDDVSKEEEQKSLLVNNIKGFLGRGSPYAGYAERILTHKVFQKALQQYKATLRKKGASARAAYRKTWEDEVVEEIYSVNTRNIPVEDLGGANAISVLHGTDDKLLGKYGRLSKSMSTTVLMPTVYVLSHRLGLGKHLAPALFFERENEVVYCEKFIKLLDDEAEETRVSERDSTLAFLKSCKNTNGDVSGFCLEKTKTLNDALECVSPDSLDDLFLHQILLDPSDSASRNFLFQYEGAHLHVVRIDYGDGFLDRNVRYFFGASSPSALKRFGEKGQKTIQSFGEILKDSNLWKESTLNGFTPQKQYILKQRLRILHTMHQKGFFEKHSRLETMLALFYVALRASIQSNTYNYPFIAGDYLMSSNDSELFSGRKKTSFIRTVLNNVWRDLINGKKPTNASLDLPGAFINEAIDDWELSFRKRPFIEERMEKYSLIYIIPSDTDL